MGKKRKWEVPFILLIARLGTGYYYYKNVQPSIAGYEGRMARSCWFCKSVNLKNSEEKSVEGAFRRLYR